MVAHVLATLQVPTPDHYVAACTSVRDASVNPVKEENSGCAVFRCPCTTIRRLLTWSYVPTHSSAPAGVAADTEHQCAQAGGEQGPT